ncbi:hypothetical protein UFOVP74_16 [uncultured Caudovirales phage]|uniref:Uncharacterized protein n=1 Tax=uncultured Caudovirales phage TaxID=2100421 RepID=A0A6J5KYS2_9CAUD|nr:hypothetical protein UFOVP74_16 [uncultured Caudovirales phage]
MQGSTGIYIVNRDITSTTHDKSGIRTYARKGDKVLVVADYGNVAIVETRRTGRFAVNKAYLTQQSI